MVQVGQLGIIKTKANITSILYFLKPIFKDYYP